MLTIADQTTGRIGLKFLLDTHGWPDVIKAEKNSKFFFKLKKKFHGKRRALQLVLNNNLVLNVLLPQWTNTLKI